MRLSSRAFLLVIHGTRDRKGLSEIARFVRRVRRQVKGTQVEFALLTPGPSSVPSVIERLIRSGIRTVEVLPFLLFSGLHVRRDIPRMLKAMGKAHPGVTLRLARHLGPSDEVVRIAVERWRRIKATQ